MDILNKRVTNNGYYIGRPSKWGNMVSTHIPWVAKKYNLILYDTAEEAVIAYEKWLYGQCKSKNISVEDILELGRNADKLGGLLCWCHPAPCHGQVLAKYIKMARDKYGST